MEPSCRPPGCQPGACSHPCSGLICGAITSQYLLEKSRVVFQVGVGEESLQLYPHAPLALQLIPLPHRPKASAIITSSTRC